MNTRAGNPAEEDEKFFPKAQTEPLPNASMISPSLYFYEEELSCNKNSILLINIGSYSSESLNWVLYDSINI